MFTASVLAYRVLDIDGVDAKAKRQFLEDLTLCDADFLVDEFDGVDCGVDTALEIECPACFATQDVDLPFEVLRLGLVHGLAGRIHAPCKAG